MSTQQAKNQVLRYTLLGKNVLSADDAELYELANLAGVIMDPNVFKLITDLLRMNVSPTDIEKILKTMISCQGHQRRPVTMDGADNQSSGSSSSHPESSKTNKPRRTKLSTSKK